MFKTRFVFVVIFVFLSSFLFAQLPNLPSNLGNVKSADITNEQLSQISVYLQKNNMNYQQAYNLLLARG
ncbi:MAG TPA: hypothetical protein VF623_09175, partial [Segetibacter sp.]